MVKEKVDLHEIIFPALYNKLAFGNSFLVAFDGIKVLFAKFQMYSIFPCFREFLL